MIGLREDQQMKAQLVARINQLFPDLRKPAHYRKTVGPARGES